MNANKCIYCHKSGPFTDEHVISAGLGGDDRRFILENMVCKKCNSDVFSKLEASFLRRTPTALGRQFLQAKGRKRGSKANPPKLEAKSKALIDEDGKFLEIELEGHGHPLLLPQFVLTGDCEVSITGSEEISLRLFVEEVRLLLDASVTVAEKDAGATTPNCTTLSWKLGKYEIEKSEISLKLPNHYIWRTVMDAPKNDIPVSRARMFKRRNGKIVLHVTQDFGIAQAISIFRKAIEQSNMATVAKVRDIQNPLVRLDLQFDLNATGRVLAKIGLNMLTHLLGDEYITHSSFQLIKNSIFNGTPPILSFPSEANESLKIAFSGLPSTHHGFALFALSEGDGICNFGLFTRLYGSQIEVVHLGRGFPMPNFDFPVFFTVDYGNHVIEMHNMLEFISKYSFR